MTPDASSAPGTGAQEIAGVALGGLLLAAGAGRTAAEHA